MACIKTIIKNIKTGGLRAYIINEIVTRNELDDISHNGYFIIYEATTVLIMYWNPYQLLLSTDPIMLVLMNRIIIYP